LNELLVVVCKGSFFQKMLMRLSYPQTYESFYFLEHENLHFGD
jgi:hypothetical protein